MKLQAYFTGFSSKSDGSAGLRFATQEIDADTFAELKKELNNFGHLLFKGNDISLDEIPKEDADEKMTPSQELRWLLMKYHKQNGGKREQFNSYYRDYMSKLIENVRNKLDSHDN